MKKKKVLMAASVASMIDQFNMPNIRLLLELGYEVHVACNFLEGNTCDRRRIRKLQKTRRKEETANQAKNAAGMVCAISPMELPAGHTVCWRRRSGAQAAFGTNQAASLCVDTLPFTDRRSDCKNCGTPAKDQGDLYSAWISFL